MSAPLSKYWVVTYCFSSNSFNVVPLPRYLRDSQKAIGDHAFFEYVVVGIHPSEQGALDELSVWAQRKEESALPLGKRLAVLRRWLRHLERLHQKHGDNL